MSGQPSSPTRGTTTTTDRTTTEGTTMVTGRMVIIIPSGKTDSTGKTEMGSKDRVMAVLMEDTITKTMERFLLFLIIYLNSI